jgi:dCTP diphosphatase
MSEIDLLMQEIRKFAERRNWGQFHTPKNLAMALAGEAGELLAEFQWLTPEESALTGMTESKLSDVSLEMADVAIYLIRLADVLQIDLADAIRRKLAINETRF